MFAAVVYDHFLKLAPIRFLLADDEIDLDTGFIMLPSAVPQLAVTTAEAPTTPTGVPPATGEGPPVTPSPIETEKMVEITFSADRDALFKAWNAVANLADLAGKVNVTLRAESEKGFDKSKLQNGVMEPLREADLIE